MHGYLNTIFQPAVQNLFGKVKQLLPVFFDQLVDLLPGVEVHILHPPVVELGPPVVGDKDEDEDEEGEKGDVGGQGPTSPICSTCIEYKGRPQLQNFMNFEGGICICHQN